MGSVDLTRDAWRALRANTPLPLTPADLDRLRGLGDPVDLGEVEEVYLPLSRLLNLFVTARTRLCDTVGAFLGGQSGPVGRRDTAGRGDMDGPGGQDEAVRPTPFIIGVAGSVAVGKSTTARLLRTLLARWPQHPGVELVTTDSFLHANAVLGERGLMDRKGFPESYDHDALLDFATAIKAGAAELSIPVYSHLQYDIVPEARQTIRRPDILIVEGLHVLRPPPAGSLGLADFLDFSIYVDARVEDIRQWFLDRLLALRRTTFTDPRSFFHQYARLAEDEFAMFGKHVWQEINEVNLVSNILPTRDRATLVLDKAADHTVRRVRLRHI